MSALGASRAALTVPTHNVLANGLRVLTAPLPHTHRAAISLLIRCGSRFEPAHLPGISHFHEHMLHRGTSAHPSAHTLALAFETLGSELSAATYVDHTLLSCLAPPENLTAVLSLLGDVVCDPVFTNLEIERGIVHEEILESLSEDGEPVDAAELLQGLVFADHGLGRPIAGTLAALARFDVPTLREFHAATYRANGMVLCVAGAIDASAVLDTAARAFGPVEPGGIPATQDPPKALAGPLLRHVRDTGSQVALRLAFRAPSERDATEPAAELLLRTIDDGMSTRLYHEVCDERGLAYDVSATYEAFADAGVLALAADAAPASTERVLSTLFDVVAALRERGPDEAEIDKVKRRAAWQLGAIIDDPLELSAFLGLGELTGIARTPEERTQRLHAVSRDDVHAVAREVFRAEELALALVGPLSSKRLKALEQSVRGFG